MLNLKSILHPTDFSEHSRYAFRLACSLARDHGAKLIVLHVVPTLGPEFIPLGEGESRLQPEGFHQRLHDELHALHSPSDIPLTHRLSEGDAVDEILRAAQQDGCDMIVLGTHGHTGLKRLLMGSVAEQVVRRASCPVLTVKAPHQFAPGDIGSGENS
jgi:nucleotide-binding universal stress UspA family protein